MGGQFKFSQKKEEKKYFDIININELLLEAENIVGKMGGVVGLKLVRNKQELELVS